MRLRLICFIAVALLVSAALTACNPEDFFYDLFCCWFFPPMDESVGGGPSVERYEIEFDHQTDYDPFTLQGQAFVQSCVPVTCWLDFVPSDDTLPNQSIHINDIADYYINHMEHNWTGFCNEHPYYLCGVKSLWGYANEQYYEYVGGIATSVRLTYCGYQPVAFICVENALEWDDYYGPAFVTLHELGHSLFDLTHMCMDEDSTLFNFADHDPGDRECIMTPTPDPECGDSPFPDLHFCDSCFVRMQRCTPRG